MRRFSVALLALAIASAPVVSAVAQDAYMDGAGAATGNGSVQQDAAPIVRQPPQSPVQDGAQDNDAQQGYASQGYAGPQGQQGYVGQQGYDDPQANQRMSQPPMPQVVRSQPVRGVMVRADHANALQTVSSGPRRTELRLDRGVADVMVHGPAPDMLLLVDLPGGQTQLLKDGFYAFNASTNTVQVLGGEADVFVAASDTPIKVKEGKQVTFSGAQTQVAGLNPDAVQQNVLPENGPEGRGGPGYGEGYAPGYGPGYGYAPYGAYAYAPYGGFYGGYPYGPYYAWGYPYYGYGYPFGFGLGFGFGGGFYGGGGYYGGHGYRGGGYHGGGYGGGGGFHGGGGGFHGGGGGASHGGGGGHR